MTRNQITGACLLVFIVLLFVGATFLGYFIPLTITGLSQTPKVAHTPTLPDGYVVVMLEAKDGYTEITLATPFNSPPGADLKVITDAWRLEKNKVKFNLCSRPPVQSGYDGVVLCVGTIWINSPSNTSD